MRKTALSNHSFTKLTSFSAASWPGKKREKERREREKRGGKGDLTTPPMSINKIYNYCWRNSTERKEGGGREEGKGANSSFSSLFHFLPHSFYPSDDWSDIVLLMYSREGGGGRKGKWKRRGRSNPSTIYSPSISCYIHCTSLLHPCVGAEKGVKKRGRKKKGEEKRKTPHRLILSVFWAPPRGNLRWGI